ncbi:hypothetical protein LguiA_007119 [Lonicera macranthoides]
MREYHDLETLVNRSCVFTSNLLRISASNSAGWIQDSYEEWAMHVKGILQNLIEQPSLPSVVSNDLWPVSPPKGRILPKWTKPQPLVNHGASFKMKQPMR